MAEHPLYALKSIISWICFEINTIWEKNIKKIQKTFKKGIDKWENKWYTNKAVAREQSEREAEASLKNFFKKLLKKYLTKRTWCDIIARSLDDGRASRSLKIEQQDERWNTKNDM